MTRPKFTHEIVADAGYDFRDDVTDQRGCHGLSFRFILVGPLGAITWVLMTGLMERPVDDLGWGGVYSKVPPKRAKRPGFDRTQFGFPSMTAGAIGSHCHEQRVDWWAGPYPCDVLGGECYGDTGFLIGDQALARLLKEGSEGVFTFLREIYEEWLVKADDR